MGYMMITTVDRKRQNQLERIKQMYGVSGVYFYRRPDFRAKGNSSWHMDRKSELIENKTTTPQQLKNLLDALLFADVDDSKVVVHGAGFRHASLDTIWELLDETK